MDYIESRKKVYVPEYYELMKNTEMALYWKNECKKGTDIVVYDFDGPNGSKPSRCYYNNSGVSHPVMQGITERSEKPLVFGPRTVDGQVQCVELTLELLQEKIHETGFPFGHGYIVAGFIKDIEPDEYIK